ncbi:biopolymer transporter ExbD [bacterium]|nr:biopolymer transporter ExbD [bacterium]
MAFPASKRKRIEGHLKKPEQLRLTSMIDMFTILLVFLLKSYSAVEFNVQISKDLHLPTSISQKLPVETVILTVAQNSVLVDGEVVANVDQEFEIVGAERDAIELPTLTAVLKNKYSRFSRQAKGRGEEFRGDITIQADQDIPYKLVKRVIKSAGDAGFANFKLMAFKEERAG